MWCVQSNLVSDLCLVTLFHPLQSIEMISSNNRFLLVIIHNSPFFLQIIIIFSLSTVFLQNEFITDYNRIFIRQYTAFISYHIYFEFEINSQILFCWWEIEIVLKFVQLHWVNTILFLTYSCNNWVIKYLQQNCIQYNTKIFTTKRNISQQGWK